MVANLLLGRVVSLPVGMPVASLIVLSPDVDEYTVLPDHWTETTLRPHLLGSVGRRGQSGEGQGLDPMPSGENRYIHVKMHCTIGTAFRK